MSVLAGVRNPDDGAELERGGKGRVTPIILDISRDDSIERAAGRVRSIVGEDGLFALVNNAAAGPYRPFEKFSLRDFEVTFSANVRAPLLLAQLVVPDMRARRRGWIVDVSSASAEPPQGPP